MSVTLGLRVGESFAEAMGRRDSKIIVQNRWYLPRRPLAEGLRDCLNQLTEGQPAPTGSRLLISSSRVEQSLTRHQGTVPAFLTTAGFEAWLPLHAPVATPAFAARAERAWLPLDPERTFGIEERVLADGSVARPLKMEELDFLVAKLELLKIKNVAIGFLHSDLNPEHENQAARHLTEKGFSVFTSVGSDPQKTARGECERWLCALEAAYVDKTAREELAELEASARDILGETFDRWQIEVWTDQGLEPITSVAPARMRHGFERAMVRSITGCQESLVLHLGLEKIFALRQPGVEKGEPRDFAPASFLPIPIQATSTIEIGDWSVPQFTLAAKGFEPGPMLFGKSHHLTPIDILYVADHLRLPAEFQELVGDKSRGRILESLFTLGKMIPGNERKSTIDASDVAAALETAWIETIVATLSRWSPKSIRLTGALAPSLLPLLHKRRPDWAFAIGGESDMAEAFATCDFKMQAPTSLANARRVLDASSISEMGGALSAARGGQAGAAKMTTTQAGTGGAKKTKASVPSAPPKPVVKTVTRGGGIK